MIVSLVLLTWNTTEGKYLLSFFGLHCRAFDGTILGLDDVLLPTTETTHYQFSTDDDHNNYQGAGNGNKINLT